MVHSWIYGFDWYERVVDEEVEAKTDLKQKALVRVVAPDSTLPRGHNPH